MAAPPPSPGDGSQKDVFMKILVVGDVNTGKTSICKKIVFDAFSTNYKATIGVDFYSKKLRWDANTTVRLQLWDIAGNERFGTMTKVYYREAVGAIVVYDVTKPKSFEAVKKWKQDLDSNVAALSGATGSFVLPAVLLANKADLLIRADGSAGDPEVARTTEVSELIESMKFTKWFATSAKSGANVRDATTALVQKILAVDTGNALGALGASKRDVVDAMASGRGSRQFQSDPPAAASSCC